MTLSQVVFINNRDECGSGCLLARSIFNKQRVQVNFCMRIDKIFSSTAGTNVS